MNPGPEHGTRAEQDNGPGLFRDAALYGRRDATSTLGACLDPLLQLPRWPFTAAALGIATLLSVGALAEVPSRTPLSPVSVGPDRISAILPEGQDQPEGQGLSELTVTVRSGSQELPGVVTAVDLTYVPASSVPVTVVTVEPAPPGSTPFPEHSDGVLVLLDAGSRPLLADLFDLEQ